MSDQPASEPKLADVYREGYTDAPVNYRFRRATA